MNTTIKFYLLIALFVINTANSESLDVNEQFRMDVQRSMEADEYEIMLAGEREVLLMVQQATSALSKGVAILINESGQAPLGSSNLAPLANYLNQYGWVTMLMPAPTVGFTHHQPDEAEEQESETATEATETQPQENELPLPMAGTLPITEDNFSEHEQQLSLQLQAVLQKSRQYPGFILVVAQGTTAAWLAKLYSEQTITQPDGFVAIAPYWPQKSYNKQVPEYLAQVATPVLDIFNQWDNSWSRKTRKLRLIAATRSLKLQYRQREIIGQSLDQTQYSYLSKEIYGWLTQMGW